MSNSDNTAETLSLEDFQAVKNELIARLISELELEIEMGDFELDDQESDIWETPMVDSKTLVKLSPIVEELTGKKIKPEWIKCGGYESVQEAVSDLVKQIELDFDNGEG